MRTLPLGGPAIRSGPPVLVTHYGRSSHRKRPATAGPRGTRTNSSAWGAELSAGGGCHRTRRGADRVTRQLVDAGVRAVAIHGSRSQPQRQRALSAFVQGHATALVATDVAARGIHVDAIGCVVHFDPPGDAKDYVHRSGRTARAGAVGTVVSLVATEEQPAVRALQRQLGLEPRLRSPDGTLRADVPSIPRVNPRQARPAPRRNRRRAS